MIPRERRGKLLVLLQVIHLVVSQEAETQNGRTYDTNEWIPITPSSVPREVVEESQVGEKKEATGRVLNLDAPAQKFLLDSEHEYRKQHPQQYAKGPPNGRRHKVKNPPDIKFEVPPPVLHEQPPPLRPSRHSTKQQPIDQQVPIDQKAPAPDAQSIYEQYNIPFNASFYESLNPSSINQEILGAIRNNYDLDPPATTPATEKEQSVQLLYVPLESLQQTNQPIPQDTKTVYRQLDSPVTDRQFYTSNADPSKQQRLANIQQDFILQALQASRLQQQLQQPQPILLQTTTTTTPKPKRKPHQPPLAIFMSTGGEAQVSDVLDTLRNAKSIPVQDNIHPNSPKIFIGPSTLKQSDGFTKFPLPYLNNMDGNRVERKIDELPFFVAPLSYKTPNGYSKIPLPSPHVGSVVVSTKNGLENKVVPQKLLIQPNQINDYKVLRQQPVRQNLFADSVSAKPAVQYINPYLPETSHAVPQNDFVPIDPPRYHIPQRPAPQLIEQVPIKQEYVPQVETTSPPPRPELVQYQPEPVQHTKLPQYNPREYTRPSSPIESPYTTQDTNIPVTLLSEERLVKPTINITPKTIPKSQLQELLEESQRTKTSSQPLTSLKSQNPEINPLELAINEFELHQINSQLLEPNKRKVVKEDAYSLDEGNYNNLNGRYVSSTQAPIVEQVVTTSRPERSKARRRKPTRRPNVETTTTERAPENKYTVLEEFSIKKPSTESYAEQTYVEPQRRPLPQSEQASDATPTTTSTSTTTTTTTTSTTTTENPTYESEILSSIFPDSFLQNSREQDGVYREQPSQGYQDLKTVLGESGPVNSYSLDEVQPIYSKPRANPRTRQRQPQRQQTFSQDVSPQRQQSFSQEVPPQRQQTFGQEVSTQRQQTFSQDDGQISQSREVENPKIRPDIASERGRIQHQQEFVQPQTSTTQRIRQQEEYSTSLRSTISATDFSVTPQSILRDEGVSYESNVRERPEQKYTSRERPNVSTEEPYSQFSVQPEEPSEHDVYLSNLQDSAVRSLLDPKLLAPTSTEQQLPSTTARYKSRPTSEELQEIVSTVRTTQPTTTTEATTTRAPRTRGRTRGNGSRFAASSTTTSIPRRRRPVARTSVERTTQQPDYGYREENEATRRSSTTKQRLRTRGRPATQQQVAEQRISTTENDVKLFREQEAPVKEEPQSFIQFEHTIEDQKIITVKPDGVEETSSEKEYHQVYTLPEQPIYSQPTSAERPRLQYDNTNTATGRTPVVDVQITHPIDTNSKEQEINIITKPQDSHEYVKYSSNIQPLERVTINRQKEQTQRQKEKTQRHREEPQRQKEETQRHREETQRQKEETQRHREETQELKEETQRHREETQRQKEERQPARTRGRTRGRSRFPATPTTTTTSTTTRRAITRPPTTEPPQEAEEEEEFYGFIRQPNFGPPPKLEAETQNKKTIVSFNQDYNTERAPVKFVGEIRPKYYSSTVREPVTTTTQAPEVETQRPRIRARTRGPSRATTNRRTETESRTRNPEEVTRRSGSATVRSRGRGTAHYRVPENLRGKPTDDEDVEGGNYPSGYVQKRQSSTTPAPPIFQIMIEPDDDQASYSSINRPQIVAIPENWTSVTAPANQIPDDSVKTEKVLLNDDSNPAIAFPILGSSGELIRAITEAVNIDVKKETVGIEEELHQNADIISESVDEEPTTKKGRRRGTWKLVKQKPLDPLETAESQNYHSVINAFDTIAKVKPTDKELKEIKQSITHYQTYNNFNPVLEQNSETYEYESRKVETTTPVNDRVTTKGPNIEEENSETESITDMIADEITTISPTPNEPSSTTESFLDALYEMLGVTSGSKENENEKISLTTQPAPSETPTTLPNITENETELPVTSIPEKSNATDAKNDQNSVESTTIIVPETTQVLTESSSIPDVVRNTPKGVEPWEMRAVKTSTSTEVSHETEICYKGRCVKSHDEHRML